MMNLMLRGLLLLALVGLTACAGPSQTKSGGAAKKDEAAVMERALARWDLLIKRNAWEAWNYLSPGYRATHPQDVWAKEMSQRPAQWYEASPFVPGEGSTAKPVQCDETGESCEVRVRLKIKIRSHLTSVGMLDTTSVVLERWVKLKDQWYLVPKDVAG